MTQNKEAANLAQVLEEIWTKIGVYICTHTHTHTHAHTHKNLASLHLVTRALNERHARIQGQCIDEKKSIVLYFSGVTALKNPTAVNR